MRDEGLVEELGALAARESAACGINWIFSPCAAVALDLRWGRTYESFSEDPALCGRLSAAEVRGIQRCGLPMAACAKHWVADGGTALGTGKFDMGGIGKAVNSFGLDLSWTFLGPFLDLPVGGQVVWPGPGQRRLRRRGAARHTRRSVPAGAGRGGADGAGGPLLPGEPLPEPSIAALPRC